MEAKFYQGFAVSAKSIRFEEDSEKQQNNQGIPCSSSTKEIECDQADHLQ